MPFVLFGSRYFLDLNNGVRQMIVASMFIYASRFIVDKKPWHYAVFILLGATIHQSVYMLIPFYFIANKVIVADKRKLMLLVFTICFMAGQTPAFQSFMGEFFRGDFGQFFTPKPIVEFIVTAIGVNKDWKILDTSCGSGGFLLHALKTVRDDANEIFSDEIGSASWRDYWHVFAEKHLFGIEINEQISRVAKMNMIIHDDGHTNIITNDGLKNNRTLEIENRNLNFQDGTFDLIMTNPPFGSTIKADEVGYYKEYELFEKNLGFTEIKDRIADDNNKNKWRTSQSTEVLFLERCYKYLNEENGYLAIVVPDGILTNLSSQYVRDWLIEKFRILAVVSLPQHTFAHVKAGVKSSVLFLKKHPKVLTQKFEQTLSDVKAIVRKEKGLDKEQRSELMLKLYKERIFKYFDNYEVLMINIENVGYDTTGKKISGNELPEIANKLNTFFSSL